MGKKIGRNEPCPCGSGKKYKKCCGAEASTGGTPAPLDWIPEEDRTGTIWDDYMDLVPAVAMYAKKIMQFDEDGRELERAVEEFEKEFHPGEKDGITDSYFLSWMHFDLRFGPSLQTVCERLLDDPMIAKLHEPGPTYLRQLGQSYLTFYEIIEVVDGEDAVVTKELGTGDRFTALHVRRLLEIEPVAGELWFARRVGYPDHSIFYTTPFVFDPATLPEFRRIVGKQKEVFSRGPRAGLFPRERHFAESQKEAARFWAWYILEGWRGSPSVSSEEKEERTADGSAGRDAGFGGGGFPRLVTTDGEDLVLTEVNFRIRDEAGLRKRLAKLKSFVHDDRDESWTWLQAKSRKFPNKPRTVLARFRIRGSRLVAETNSRERAGRLRIKLKKHLGDLIAYDKTLYREPDDFPEYSPEEREKMERESEELHSRPEVQAALRQHLEHHYFEEWPSAKLPALGGKTPLQAVRSEKGKREVLALIEDMEHLQDTSPSHMPNIDFDRLRRLLGLPPRVN